MAPWLIPLLTQQHVTNTLLNNYWPWWTKIAPDYLLTVLQLTNYVSGHCSVYVVAVITGRPIRQHERKRFFHHDLPAETKKKNCSCHSELFAKFKHSVNFWKCSALPQNCQVQLFVNVITFCSHCGSSPFILGHKTAMWTKRKKSAQGRCCWLLLLWLLLLILPLPLLLALMTL